MRTDLSFNSTLTRVIMVAALMVATYYILALTIGGTVSRIVLLIALVYSGMVIVNPRLGLYSLCVSLLLVPNEFHVAGTEPLSPNLVVMATAAWAWGMSVVLGGLIFRSTVLYVPMAIAGDATWIGLVRYGTQFTLVPMIFTESIILFVTTFHLLRDRTHVRRLLMVLVIAFLVRNAIDVGQTIYSLQAGSVLGAIRDDTLLFGGKSTSESDLRALVLPLMIMGFAYAPNRASRIVIGISLTLDVVWLGLAGTRTGALGLIVAVGTAMVLFPKSKRTGAAVIMLSLTGMALLVATQLSGAGTYVWERTQRDLEIGFEGGRAAIWADGLNAFVASPLIGSGMGASHSYFLGSARKMGLAFLLPFFVAMVIVWRHCAWLRNTQSDRQSYALASGMMGMLIVVLVLSSTGTLLIGMTSFFFWILVGVVESVYLSARIQRSAGDKVPKLRTDSAFADAGQQWTG